MELLHAYTDAVSNFRPAIERGAPLREWENLEWIHDDADPRAEVVRRESAQIQEVIRALLAAGAVELKGSPLTDASRPLEDIGPEDISRLRRMRLAAAPLTAKNNRLHAHLEVAGIYAGQLATAVNAAQHLRLPTRALHAAGELNDIGKLSGVFRYHFNDVLGDAMLEDLGIHPGVKALFMPTEFHVGPVSVEQAAKMGIAERDGWVADYCDEIFNALTREQKIFIYADVCGKPKGPKLDDIQTFADMREVHLRTRASGTAYQQYIGAKEPVWPSEIYAIRHIEGFADGWMTIYERIQSEFEAMGVDLEEVRGATRAIWQAANGPERHTVA